MKKPSQIRKKHEVLLLEKSLKSVKFLQELKQQMNEIVLEQLHYKLKYEFVPKRRVVFNLGEMGKKFYIILKGSVYILLKKVGLEPSVDQEESTIKLNSNNEKENKKGNLRKVMKENSSVFKETNEITDEIYIASKFPNFMIIRVMNSGESFGEVALRQNVARQHFILSKCLYKIYRKNSNYSVQRKHSFCSFNATIISKYPFGLTQPIQK